MDHGIHPSYVLVFDSYRSLHLVFYIQLRLQGEVQSMSWLGMGTLIQHRFHRLRIMRPRCRLVHQNRFRVYWFTSQEGKGQKWRLRQLHPGLHPLLYWLFPSLYQILKWQCLHPDGSHRRFLLHVSHVGLYTSPQELRLFLHNKWHRKSNLETWSVFHKYY